jgi:hypothetical protein
MSKLLKAACAVSLAVWLMTDSTAQTLEVKGGLNMTTLTGNADNSFRPGLYFGFAHEIPLSRYVSLQPEILYSLQGTYREPAHYWYHYIQVPLYFNFKIAQRAGILWGPQVGLLARANVKRRDYETWSMLPLMKPFDLSIGGGPYARIGDRLKAELRIAVGVAEISRENESLRNFVIQGGVSWALNKPSDE